MQYSILDRWMTEHQPDYPDRRSLHHAAAEACGSTRKYANERLRQLERTGQLPAEGYAEGIGHTPEGQIMAAMMEHGLTCRVVETPAPGQVVIASRSTSLDEAALRGEIDAHFKARRFLESIPSGQFYRIDDAAVAAGIPKTGARALFFDARYDAYRGQAFATQVTYLGHPDRIAAMKLEGIMR